MQKDHLQKKVITIFLLKTSYLEQEKKNLILFSSLKIFSKFLVRVVNIVSSTKNINIDVLYRKNSKVEQYPSKINFFVIFFKLWHFIM